MGSVQRKKWGERHLERVDRLKLVAPHKCDPPSVPQCPLYRDTGRQAGRQAVFPVPLSCMLLYLALRGCRSLYLLFLNMFSWTLPMFSTAASAHADPGHWHRDVVFHKHRFTRVVILEMLLRGGDALGKEIFEFNWTIRSTRSHFTWQRWATKN